MKFPQTHSNSIGTTTTHDFKEAFWGKFPCYYVHASGSREAYFRVTTEIYQLEELPDGSWKAWYYSTDAASIAYRDCMVEMGAWAR